MLNQEDLKWIATTTTDLNSLLQQISRYSDLARRHHGEANYMELLAERVERASKNAQALFDRVTNQILEKTIASTPPAPRSPHHPFTVLPPPMPSSATASSPAPAMPARAVAASVMAAPVAVAEPPRRAAAVTQPIPSDIKVKNPRGNRELILLVEDEVEVADLCGEMLADEGYKVIVAHDGFEALKIYQRLGKQIGLVLLDFFLPIMDGDAVFDELRALNPDIDVMLSSGFAEQQKISAMLAQGLRGFIPKPHTRAKLMAQVRSTLDAAAEAGR